MPESGNDKYNRVVMEDFLVWLIWAAVIGGSIASSASKAKKKREEEARKAAQARQAAPTDARAARVAAEQGSVERYDSRPASRPATIAAPKTATTPQPTYYSLEDEYDAADGWGYHDSYSAEESDAEQRYVGGERYLGGERRYADAGDHFETEIAAYERLVAKRAERSRLTPATDGKTAAGTGQMAVDFPAADPTDGNDVPVTLREVLGGEFDLRRAVVESEILTPKYVARY